MGSSGSALRPYLVVDSTLKLAEQRFVLAAFLSDSLSCCSEDPIIAGLDEDRRKADSPDKRKGRED